MQPEDALSEFVLISGLVITVIVLLSTFVAVA